MTHSVFRKYIEIHTKDVASEKPCLLPVEVITFNLKTLQVTICVILKAKQLTCTEPFEVMTFLNSESGSHTIEWNLVYKFQAFI